MTCSGSSAAHPLPPVGGARRVSPVTRASCPRAGRAEFPPQVKTRPWSLCPNLSSFWTARSRLSSVRLGEVVGGRLPWGPTETSGSVSDMHKTFPSEDTS